MAILHLAGKFSLKSNSLKTILHSTEQALLNNRRYWQAFLGTHSAALNSVLNLHAVMCCNDIDIASELKKMGVKVMVEKEKNSRFSNFYED